MKKAPGRKRKTLLYWKGVLKQAGIDWTDAGRIASDRKGWRALVKRRMDHLERSERSRGNLQTTVSEKGSDAEAEPSNQEDGWPCKWPGCIKICTTKAGLGIHQRRIHKETDKSRSFPCLRCQKAFKSENTMINHAKTCGGETTDDSRRRCENCGKEVSKGNIARHRRACTEGEEAGGARGMVRAEVRARKYTAKWKDCPQCGRQMSATNMARHQKTCRGQ